MMAVFDANDWVPGPSTARFQYRFAGGTSICRGNADITALPYHQHMHWVLQRGFHTEAGWSSLIAALERFGIDYSEHAVAPRTGDLLPAPVFDHRNAICIGSYSMRHAAARYRWSPGLFDLIDQDFERQRAHWGRHMLNAESRVCALSEAIFDAERMFVRPAADNKHFTGKVFAKAEFEAWREAICAPDASHSTSLTPGTQIQFCVPSTIHAEYRFWIVAGEIVTQSLYRRGGAVFYASDVDDRLHDFVAARIAEWSPHETFVIDVCDTPNGIRIVEINTLNSSGFYAADLQRLVLALEVGYSIRDR
jgi:ATP-grasp domain, R2K clade family 3